MKLRPYTYDLPLDDLRGNPVAGDIIRHVSLVRGVVSWFTVIEARPVDSSVWANRFRLTVRREAGPPQDAADHARIWPSTPYSPGERPGDRMAS